MQKLPNINPLDTNKYPNGMGTFNVGAADAGAKILMYNESPLNIDLDFYNGYTDTLHAWEANYWTLDGDTPQLGWQIDPDSPVVTTPPINAVFLTLYGPTERLQGTYPMALVRQANVGNTTGVQSNNVGSTLSNTGNPPGANVVTVGSTGATGNDWTVTNDGLWKLAVTIAAVLVQVLQTNESDPILQLGSSGYTVEVLGKLLIDQLATLTKGATLNGALQVNAASTLGDTTNKEGATVNGPLTTTGAVNGMLIGEGELGLSSLGDILDAFTVSGNTYLKAATEIHFQIPNGTEIFTIDSGGPQLQTGNMGFLAGSISRIQGGKAVSVNANSTITITHNLGATPSIVLVSCDSSGSTSTSHTSNYTSTTFDLYSYAACSYDWLAVCF